MATDADGALALTSLSTQSTSSGDLSALGTLSEPSPLSTAVFDIPSMLGALAITRLRARSTATGVLRLDGRQLVSSLSSTITTTTKNNVLAGSRIEAQRSSTTLSAIAAFEGGSRVEGQRVSSTQASVALLKAASKNESLLMGGAVGFNILDHLDITLEDALSLTVEITDTLSLDVTIDG